MQFDRTQSKWHVGARCFTVGATFARRRNFSAQAVPYLRKLRIRELERVRRQGFAIDDEDACMGLRCIAAVVYNGCSEPLAAISVSGMTSRLTDDRLAALGQTVRDVAAELTVALGGAVPAATSS